MTDYIQQAYDGGAKDKGERNYREYQKNKLVM